MRKKQAHVFNIFFVPFWLLSRHLDNNRPAPTQDCVRIHHLAPADSRITSNLQPVVFKQNYQAVAVVIRRTG
jgi:hypothetical protein